MSDHARRGRVDLLDYLRLLAALAVVFHHWVFNGIVNGKISSLDELSPAASVARYGYLGVTLFFLISGFVIYGSVEGKAPDAFAVGRAVRLYPAFWAGVCLTTLVGVLWGEGRFDVSPVQFVANLTMVPAALGQPLVDGVYWTLAYELVFYVAIFLVIAAGLGAGLHRLLPMWAIAMLFVTLVSPSLGDQPFLGNYYSYFAAGAIISTFRRHGVTRLSALGLASACYVSLDQAVGHADAFERKSGYAFSPVVVVIATLAFYGAVLVVSSDRARRVTLPMAALTGALTYPVYLLHAHIGYVVISRLATPQNQWFVYAGLLVVVLATAYALHVVVERWPKTFWYAAFEGTVGRVVRTASHAVRRRPAGARFAADEPF